MRPSAKRPTESSPSSARCAHPAPQTCVDGDVPSKAVVNLLDGHGPLADCRRNTLYRAVAHVPHCKHTRNARLQHQWHPGQRIAARAALANCVLPGEQVTPTVALDL